MPASDTKHKDIEDFESHYIRKEMITSFRQHVSLSFSGDEEKVIMEARCTTERANIATLDDSTSPYFYLYLPIVCDLGILVAFFRLRQRF